MTIEMLGSVGEFVAAIATLITLVYLTIQIRQNSKLMGESAKRATQATVYETNLLLFKDAEALELIRRGMEDWSSLSLQDRARFHSFWMTTFINYQEAFYQVRELGVDDEWWRILEAHLLRYLGSPGLNDWWEQNQELFGDRFVRFVEGKRAELGAGDPSTERAGWAVESSGGGDLEKGGKRA
jgi:hypothetical protein